MTFRNQKGIPILFAEKSDCCGCTACFAACPVHAITMCPDREGFLYPNIDPKKCIRCYRCLSVCAFKTDRQARNI